MVGRVKQKQRTRQALVDAARGLLRDGREVTITAAAQAADVSTATAYRYFSQPHELVLETVVADAAVVPDLPDDPAERLDAVVSRLASLQLRDEPQWRAVLAASLRGAGEGGSGRARTGARLAMTRRALEPLAAELGPGRYARLVHAVMLVYGMEATVVLRDACGLDPDEAADVMRWAARALLRATLDEAGQG